MLSRSVNRCAQPLASGARGMATAQQLRARVKSVKNLVKITSAKKTVATVKLRRAREALDKARDFTGALEGVWPKIDLGEPKQPLYIGISADKGLCGGINSSISRALRDCIVEDGDLGKAGKIFMVGEKSKLSLERTNGKQYVTTVSEAGGQGMPTFKQVAILADIWANIPSDRTTVYYQKFRSVIAYDTTKVFFWSWDAIEKAEGGLDSFYDFEQEGGADILQNLCEFRLSTNLYLYLFEQEASMLSATMQAMENSSKNAKEMVDSLTLLLNRNRQTKITTELTEIVSGAAALEDGE